MAHTIYSLPALLSRQGRFPLALGLIVSALAQSPNFGAFVDAADSAGLVFLHRNSKTDRKYLPETMSGGVAILDFDQDGWMDVFFVNGAKLSLPHKDGDKADKSDPKYWNRLFHNQGDGTFRDVTEKYGMGGRGYGMGVAAGDYDNDGYPDLLVTNQAAGRLDVAVLYHNDQGKGFSDVTERSGIHARGWATSAGFFDYDNDGDLDLFVCRYVKWSFEQDRRCGVGSTAGRSYCHPDEFEPISSYLFRNDGGGTFSDVSGPSGIEKAKGKGLGLAFADFNRDGRIDIFVANDSVPQFLFKNEGDGSFTEIAMMAGVALDDDGRDFGGMGADFADLDDDGLADILATTISLQGYAFFRNTGDELFEYQTHPSNLGRITRNYTGWGVRVFDFDNDGRKDVFFANGHVMDNIELSQPNIRYLQPPLLLRRSGERFVDASAEGGEIFQRGWAGRGAAVGDLNNDGYLDIVATNLNGRNYFARSQGKQKFGNHWLAIKLRGRKSNRDGIGARVILRQADGRTQHRLATRAAGYQSAQDPRLFFGLGKSNRIESVTIEWPSGVEQIIATPPADQILLVEEPLPDRTSPKTGVAPTVGR